ncbi:hypothetical protein JCM3765_005274 [Sporobolomyces pararoseus]
MIRSISHKGSNQPKSLLSKTISNSRTLSTLPNTPPRNAGFLQTEKNLMWLSGIGLLGIGTWWWVQRNDYAKEKQGEAKDQVKQGGGKH